MRKRLRILFVVEAAATGVARHIFDLLDGLQARGHTIDVLYSPLREDALFRADRLARPDVRFAAVAMRRAPGVQDLRPLRKIRRFIRANGPYDILHGHSSKGGLMARLAAPGSGARVVYTPHAISTLDPTRAPLPRLVYGLGERVLALATDALIAVSSQERTAIGRLGIPLRKVVCIRNAVAPLPPGPDRRGDLGLAPDDVVIGFVGRCSRQKAIDVLVAAFAAVRRKVPAARLLVIGDGPEKDSARRQAEAEGCAADIRWLGACDARAWYPSFDLLALPSRYEGLSYTLLEAAAAGLPIVASDVGGVRDVVADGLTGRIVPPGNTEALADALALLTRDSALRARYAEAARTRRRPGPARMVARTETLYRILCCRGD